MWSVQDAPGEILFDGTVILLCISWTGWLYCVLFFVFVGDHVINFGYFR